MVMGCKKRDFNGFNKICEWLLVPLLLPATWNTHVVVDSVTGKVATSGNTGVCKERMLFFKLGLVGLL